MKRPDLDDIVGNLEHLSRLLGTVTDPGSILTLEDCYKHNLEALHHYHAWDELRHYKTWFKDYKGES